jgi:hypothetical protein
MQTTPRNSTSEDLSCGVKTNKIDSQRRIQEFRKGLGVSGRRPTAEKKKIPAIMGLKSYV